MLLGSAFAAEAQRAYVTGMPANCGFYLLIKILSIVKTLKTIISMDRNLNLV